MVTRRLATLLVSLALFLGLVGVGGQGTASAHPLKSLKALGSTYCQYNQQTCDGQDPYWTYGPDGHPCKVDGRVVEQTNVEGGYVQEWWSANCGTNWAETWEWVANFSIMNANITRGSDRRHYDGTWYSYGGVYSPMVFAPDPNVALACGSMNNWPGGCAPWG